MNSQVKTKQFDLKARQPISTLVVSWEAMRRVPNTTWIASLNLSFFFFVCVYILAVNCASNVINR